MTTCPVRELVAVLGSMLNRTSPSPLPFAPDVTLIHDTWLTAVRGHADDDAVTSMRSVTPNAGTEPLVALNEKVQPLSCVTVNVWPAMSNVPVLDGPVVESTPNDTLPLPLPPGPDVIVNHGDWLAALHSQPAPAVTLMGGIDGPPEAGTVRDVGFREYAQPFTCVTVNVCPAMTSVPVRPGPEYGSTLNATLPLPVPPGPEVIDSHDD